MRPKVTIQPKPTRSLGLCECGRGPAVQVVIVPAGKINARYFLCQRCLEEELETQRALCAVIRCAACGQTFASVEDFVSHLAEDHPERLRTMRRTVIGLAPVRGAVSP